MRNMNIMPTFDPGISCHSKLLDLFFRHCHQIVQSLELYTWCLTKCSNDFSALYRKTFGFWFDYLKPLHIVIFIFDPGSLSHVYTWIHVFHIGQLHGFISRTSSYDFRFSHAILTVLCAAMVKLLKDHLPPCANSVNNF